MLGGDASPSADLFLARIGRVVEGAGVALALARVARRRGIATARRCASALSLYLIVLTGAAVRLTGSGLACESWPGCQEGAFFPARGEHSTIEFGNRLMALFPIGLSLAAWVFAYRTPVSAAGCDGSLGSPFWARSRRLRSGC